jgi:heme/copper-type cytochrome/quinol oxidase subunit 4
MNKADREERTMNQKSNTSDTKRSKPAGLIILLILITLLIMEFAVASIDVANWIIYAFAFLQAGIIIWEYMHLSRLFPGNND